MNPDIPLPHNRLEVFDAVDSITISGRGDTCEAARVTAFDISEGSFDWLCVSTAVGAGYYATTRSLVRFDTSTLPPVKMLSRAWLALTLTQVIPETGCQFDMGIYAVTGSQWPVTQNNKQINWLASRNGIPCGIWQNSMGLTVGQEYLSLNLQLDGLNPGGDTVVALVSSEEIAGNWSGQDHVHVARHTNTTYHHPRLIVEWKNRPIWQAHPMGQYSRHLHPLGV